MPAYEAQIIFITIKGAICKRGGSIVVQKSSIIQHSNVNVEISRRGIVVVVS